MCVMACISRMTIHMMTMTTSSHRIPKLVLHTSWRAISSVYVILSECAEGVEMPIDAESHEVFMSQVKRNEAVVDKA